MGLAQWFGLLASFEFAYSIAPRSAQSLFMSVHYISRGIASYLIKPYITIMTNYSLDLKFSVSIKLEYGLIKIHPSNSVQSNQYILNIISSISSHLPVYK